MMKSFLSCFVTTRTKKSIIQALVCFLFGCQFSFLVCCYSDIIFYHHQGEENIKVEIEVKDDLLNKVDYNLLNELTELTQGQSTLSCPEPLVPFYDHIINHDDGGRKHSSARDYCDHHDDHFKCWGQIPKIIHFTTKSRCIPPDQMEYIDRWKMQFPNASIFLHDDDAIDRLIYNNEWDEFKDLHAIMPCVMKGAMLTDIWRILVVYKYGGLYTDLDNWPLDPFNESMIPNNVTFFSFSDAYNRPKQSLFAAEASFSGFIMMLHLILKSVKDLPNISTPKLLWTTGPHMFGRGFRYFLDDESKKKYKEGNRKKMKEENHDGYLTSMFQQPILKVPGPYDKYVLPKINYDDIVQSHFNTTKNMTRRERIMEENGIVHWQKEIFLNNKRKVEKISCQSKMAEANSLSRQK